MTDFVNYGKRHFLINLSFVALIIIYAINKTMYQEDSRIMYVEGALLILGVFYNAFMYIKNYFNMPSYYFYGIYSYLVPVSLAIASPDKFVAAGAMLAYVVLLIELLIVLTILNSSIKKYIIFSYLIFLAGVLLRAKSILSFGFQEGILLIFFSLIIIFVTYIIYNNILNYSDIIEGQKELLAENEAIYEELTAAQDQMMEHNMLLENLRMELEVKNRVASKYNAEIFIQNELMRYISSTLEVVQLMDLVTDAITGAAGVDICSLIIRNNNENTCKINVKANNETDIEKQLKVAVEEGLLQQYCGMQHTFVDSNVDANNYPFIKERITGSLIIVPLVIEDENSGLLIAEKANVNGLTEDNVQFFEGVATQIVIALRNARIYSQMEDMAKKDFLTKLYNRRYLQMTLSEMYDNAVEHSELLAVTLFDIDHFKRINDTYGHLFGDEAIKAVANEAMGIAEKYTGMAGRYGGEEFVVVFPNKDMEATKVIMEEFHANIKQINLTYQEDVSVKVNVSIGISVYPKYSTSADDLLNRADNAMYYSKTHGRGRITLDSERLDNSNDNN